MFADLKAKIDAIKAHVVAEEEKFRTGIRPLLHDLLDHVEEAEVKAQQVTSVAVDGTSAGADALNQAEAEKKAAEAAQSAADNSANALNSAEAAQNAAAGA